MTRVSLLPPRWLRFSVAIALTIGIIFRFANLDTKLFWHDEVGTAARISGHTNAEIASQLTNGEIVSFEEVRHYLNIDRDRSVVDVVKGLTVEEPKHTPLYFIGVRLWGEVFGDAIATLRSFSVAVSLFSFPALYWLCWELFQSHWVATIAVGLFSLSPYHVLFAQEARPYALWTVSILLSSAAVLRAVRVNSLKSWCVYTLTAIFALWSFLLSLGVVAAQGIYVAISEKLKLTRTAIAYLISVAIALIGFSPWLWVLFSHRKVAQSTASWTEVPFPLKLWILKWVHNVSSLFVDLEPNFWFLSRKTKIIIVFVFLCVALATVLFFCYAPKKARLFVLCLAGTTTLPLLLPDIIFGGQRSIAARYMIPCLLCVHLVVAYLLARGMQTVSKPSVKSKVVAIASTTAFYSLLLCGFLSLTISSPSVLWWHKLNGHENATMAAIINASPSPLLVDDSTNLHLLALTEYLDPKVEFRLYSFLSSVNVEQVETGLETIPDRFSDVFIFDPAPVTQQLLQQHRELAADRVFEGEFSIWKLHDRASGGRDRD